MFKSRASQLGIYCGFQCPSTFVDCVGFPAGFFCTQPHPSLWALRSLLLNTVLQAWYIYTLMCCDRFVPSRGALHWDAELNQILDLISSCKFWVYISSGFCLELMLSHAQVLRPLSRGSSHLVLCGTLEKWTLLDGLADNPLWVFLKNMFTVAL